MSKYPLVNISKDEWNKKVAATYMYSIPAEDQALPILQEIVAILEQIHKKSLKDVIPEESIQYFLTLVLPVVCQKVLKSRYFKSAKVLQLANKILQLSVLLVITQIEFAEKYPAFAQLTVIVFSTDQYYYKTNNQFSDYRTFVHNYIKQSEKNWAEDLKEGDLIDVLKFTHVSGKACWSRGKVVTVKPTKLKVEFLNDYYEETANLDKNSYMIAPYKSKSSNFQWRMELKIGDLVDCEDHYGGWYNSTIIEIIQKQQNKRQVKVSFKVYSQKGNKHDEKGKYTGLTGYTQDIDVTSPKIQPYCSVAKDKTYSQNGAKQNDDLNDSEFEQLSGQKLYALPRKKCLSQFLFLTINKFGKWGGFTKPIQQLQNTINFPFLCNYIKGISGIYQCLHKKIVRNLIEQLKPIIQRHIFCQTEQFLKQFTKQRSEMLFSGFKLLQIRIYSMQIVYQYENEKKMKLADKCLQSQALKRKLQGLNELKDIVKSLTYSSERNKVIKNWIKSQKIFQKIYITNSHVQMIKKSQQFFRYLINESILEVTDLQRLYKIAQKGDYQSRISLYRLFQEVSHIFKKPHVDFLIDTILQSELSLILNQDIDLLNQMSKFSNYFPKDKVRAFFQSIILGQSQHETLYEYATKKYCQIVAKGYEMKSSRRDIIHSFISKLITNNIHQVIRVLKGIFEGIGIGDYGKKQLNQILAEENIDQVIIQAIANNKSKPNWSNIVTQVLNLQGFIYKLSSKVKIYISTLKSIWNQLKENVNKRQEYIKWVNQCIGCEQGIGQPSQLQKFQSFFVELFPKHQLKAITMQQFALIKNLMLEINKKHKYLASSSYIKQHEIKRKVDMKQLKLYQYFMFLIFQIDKPEIYQKSLQFFLQIFNAKDNEFSDILKLFDDVLILFQKFRNEKQNVQLVKTLKLLNIVIDNSQKKNYLNIESLISKQKGQNITLIIINDLVYVSQYSKKKEITVSHNITLYQFKRILANIYTIEPEEIKLAQEKQIPDYYNCRIMKELPINFSDPITLGKNYSNTYVEPETIVNGKLSPRAARCFRVIFKRYSTNGLMNREQCHQFTCACLGSSSKRYEEKINLLYHNYDYDNDGFLTEDGFLQFYQDAAKENKSSTVWANLKNFNVNMDFKFPDELETNIQPQRFPRKKLADKPQFYEALFELLHVKELAAIAFRLLKRLPISKKVYTDILGIGRVNCSQELDINSIFTFQDHYSYFYKLNIISYLSESQSQIQKKWLSIFIQSKGVQLLYLKLKQFMENYSKASQFEQIQTDIINYNIKLLYQYFLRCFADDKKIEAIMLLNYEVDIDDKIEYLITGCFIKSQHKLQEINISKMYNWEGENQAHVCKVFIRFLGKVWVEWSDKIDKDLSKIVMLQKIFSIICLLQINEDPSQLISNLALFFQRPPSNKLLRHLYTLILIVCFYSSQYQNLFITQIFKHITLTNIISQYFRMLAVLVSRFGMQQEKISQMPEILLRNILNEKNELTIEGCAKLLSNFHLDKEVAEKEVEVIWDNCLFGRQTSCKKEQTRQTIYELILKFCQNNKQLTDKIVRKTLQTIQHRIKSIKIVYSNEINQRAATGYSGLKNLGNICYMNSMIQQLFMNRNFRYLLMRIQDNKEPVWTLDYKERMVDDNILHQIQRIFGYLQKTTRLDFVPFAFCTAYKPFGESVNVMIQQDVQQFISMFFDRLQIGLKPHPLRRLIDHFYTGKSVNLFTCHDCKQTKQVEQNFYSLTLQVRNTNNLSQSFNRFILGELINDFKCDFCSKKADVSKKTRISKAPQNLILHLKRIDFNMDTFINQKIASRHQFPTSFNLYQYSLEYYEKQKLNQPNLSKQNENYQYELTGIICHIGNAQQGHYISYIKNQQGKWHDFNDSQVKSFNASNIETQCFGGNLSYDDDFDWQKRQNSKSAYILTYRCNVRKNIELQLGPSENRTQLLNSLQLKEETSVECSQKVIEQQPTQSQEQSSDMVEDSQKEKEYKMMAEMQQIEMIRKHKSQDNIEAEKDAKWKEQQSKSQNANTSNIIKIKDEIAPFILPDLEKEIQMDNEVHFFQKCLASVSFSKFFAKLLILPQSNCKQMIKMCQKLTFGFWLKSPSFKELLLSLTMYMREYPSGLKEILQQNINLVNLLIENSEIDVRTNISYFLSNSFHYFINEKQLTLLGEDHSPDNLIVLSFLDNLFSLIPTTVSKSWTKFNQYFQFWYQFSKKSAVAASYMVRKEVLKHFIDYFLDKKSPLKIYFNKPQIGSTYANPNFTMLLKTIQSLIQFYTTNNIALSQEQRIILVNFNFIQKLIHDSYENIASKIVRIICPNSLYASEKIAIVLVKGISRSNYENVQTYLDVVHEFVLIEDEHQLTRMKWVLGKQNLVVSTISKVLSAMNSYSLEERIYDYSSGLAIENGNTLLELVFTQNKRTQNLCILCLQEILKLSNANKFVRDYVWNLGPPSYIYGRYIDFFEEFINRYLDQAKRIYGYSTSTGFNRQELGKNIRKLYKQVLERLSYQRGRQVLEGASHQTKYPITVEMQQYNDLNDLKQSPTIRYQQKTQKIQQQQGQYHGESKDRQYEDNQQPSRQSVPRNIIQPKVVYIQAEQFMQSSSDNKRSQSIQFQKGIQQYKLNDQIEMQPIIRAYSQSANSSQAPKLQRIGSGDSYGNQICNLQFKYNELGDTYQQHHDATGQYQDIKINVEGSSPVKSANQSDKQNNYYSSQQQNLLQEKDKDKEKVQNSDGIEKEENNEKQNRIYHPVKFVYKFVQVLEGGFENVRIQSHQSELVSVRTYPTGITNKAFTSTYSHKKVSERLPESAYQDKRVTTVKGFFVSNNTKNTIRLKTNDGSYIVRSIDSAWVWSQTIERMWVPDKFTEWPEWSLYSYQKDAQMEAADPQDGYE